MDIMIFKAYAIVNEIDVNKIAVERKIPKRFIWEEPLILKDKHIKDVIGKPGVPDQSILIYSVGSVVFINILPEDEEKFIEYLKNFKPELDIKNWNRYSDNYELRVGEENEILITDEYIVVPKYEDYYANFISMVIAKSVVLEKSEEQLGIILGKLEGLVERMEKGKLTITNKEIAYTTSKIIRHEYNTISNIMILDKPELTLDNGIAERFYDEMASFFQLHSRYQILKSKTETLEKIMAGFSSMSNSIRGLFVEWVIVILIILEILVVIFEHFV